MIEIITPFVTLIQGLYTVPFADTILAMLFSIVFVPFLILFLFRFFFALFHR